MIIKAIFKELAFEGRAPRIGIAGIPFSLKTNGDTKVPLPIENPTPHIYEIAATAKFGR